MKKYLSFFFAVLVLFSAFPSAFADDGSVRVAGLKGPTSMGLAQLLEDDAYYFTLAGSADEITPKLIRGELDIAAIPANLAAVLYNNTDGKIRVLAVNTLGVLSIVEKGETIRTMADLKGKTVYASGKGSTPEYTLRYLLESYGLDPDQDVTLEFRSEPAEVTAILAREENGVAMLPQPYVTAALASVEKLRIALDLSEEWEKLDNGSLLITGVTVGRAEFIEENPEAVEEFLKKQEESVSFVNGNIPEAAALIGKYGIAAQNIAEKAIPACNITFLRGEEMAVPLAGYLQTLFEQNPKAVGGKLPDEGFYF